MHAKNASLEMRSQMRRGLCLTAGSIVLGLGRSGLASPRSSLIDEPRITFVGGSERSFDAATGRVSIRAGTIGGQPGSGIIAYADVGIAGLEACRLSYKVEFDPDFPFRRGVGDHQALAGKLPGLHGGRVASFSPSLRPDGTNGFSVRPKFYNGGDSDRGFSGLYVWDMMAGPYGRGGKPVGPVFEPGKVHQIELLCRLNSPGKADGFVALRIDGSLVAQVEDFMARTDPGMRLAGCSLAAFFGGGSAVWAPYRDTWLRLTDFRAEAA